MRLSTKGRYAVTAMLDLAINSKDGPIALSEIFENQGISSSYLEQLFSALRSKGLVRGLREPGIMKAHIGFRGHGATRCDKRQ
ncbi:hypothetical protein CCP4SC76_3020005 [Gammaproteobacteria bacterium]